MTGALSLAPVLGHAAGVLRALSEELCIPLAGRFVQFCSVLLLTQTSLSSAQQAAVPQQPATPSTSNKFALDDGTPIKLRLDRPLSSAGAKTGDNIDFEALEEVKVNEVVAITSSAV